MERIAPQKKNRKGELRRDMSKAENTGKSNNKAEITVVIPNYNGMKYLPECLDTLKMQETGTPAFRVLVVDNGSTDGSVPYLEERAENQENEACIFLPENTGFCHAVNVGIQAAETPFVILLNNDTKVRPGFVKGLYQAINEKERVFSVSAKMLMWDREDLLDDAGDRYCALGWAYLRGKGKPASDYNKPVSVFSACGGAVIYRKSVFDTIGLFDEQHFAYLEDLDIGYRAKIYGYENRYTPDAEVVHFGSASSGSRYNPWKTKLAAANSVYVIGKNMPLFQWILNLPFLIPGFFIKFLFFCKKRMGGLYLQGLGMGFKKCFSEPGRDSKVKFQWKHFGNYVAIQIQLYANIFRIIMKS